MDLIGKLLDRKYRIGAKIGGGGFALVYKAVHLQLQQEVAVKILTAGPTQRFEQEGQAIARLRHPNIVTVYDAGRVGQINYLVMEYMPGGTLAGLLVREGQFSLERTVRVISQLAAALDYAHAQGMVHRDVKPANVLFAADGHLKLSDFGLVKTEAGGISLLTEVGQAFGTPAYMAPEQIRKEPVGPWTDIYALGVVAYQLLTGRLPFQGSMKDILVGHVRDQAPAPGHFRADLPPEVDRVILQALQKDPQQRYAQAGAFAAALEQAVQRPPIADDLPATPAATTGIAATLPPSENYLSAHPDTWMRPRRARRVPWVLLSLLPALIIGMAGMLPGFSAAPAFADSSGRIAFVSDRAGNLEIYLMDTDGTNLLRLTEHPAADRSPAWSPDGQQLAFVSERDGNAEIYLMQADGTAQRNLTNHPEADQSPAWSPDGQRIAFAATRAGNTDIYVMNSDGTGLLRLTDNPAGDFAPAWSSDGRQIAFFSLRDGNEEIYVMASDGTAQRRLTDNPAVDGTPVWSPDDQQILFDTTRDGNFEIYAMNADGTNQRNLTRAPGDDHMPVWSADGQSVVFWSTRTGNGEIYVMDAAGTNVRNLTQHPAHDTAPALSPDQGGFDLAALNRLLPMEMFAQ